VSVKYKLLVAFLLATVIPAITVILIYQQNVSKMMIDRDTKASVKESARSMQSIDRAFSQIEGVLLNFTSSANVNAYLQRVDGYNYSEEFAAQLISDMGSRLDSVMQFFREIENVYILPRKGAIPLFRGTDPLKITDDYTKKPLYRQSAMSPERIFWTTESAGSEGKIALSVTKGIVDPYTDEVLGVMIIQTRLSSLLESLAESTPEGENFYIADADDRLLFDSGIRTDASAYAALVANRPGERQGSYALKTDVRSYAASYTTSAVNGWRIYHTVPVNQIVQGINEITRLSWLFAGIFAVFAIAASIYAGVLLYRPVRLLTQAMREVENDRLNAEVPYSGRDEFGVMINAFNFLMKRIRRLLADITETEKKKTELTIQALQAQIMPHFLYNTLNTVLSMARLGKTDAIVGMIRALIDLLKISASNKKDIIRIREEIHYAKSYVKIMSYRHDVPLDVVYDVDPKLETHPILKFTLQPIIENSIFHAFDGFQGSPSLLIKIRESDDKRVTVEVSDNGVGMGDHEIAEIVSPSPVGGGSRSSRMTGIGLHNIHERYLTEYGHGYGLRISSALGEGTTVTVTYPLREEDETSADKSEYR